MSYTYEYEMPAVTVDAVILRQRVIALAEWSSQLLLIKRKNEPFKDKWALPGGFVDKNEEPVTACIREVKEETGIVLPNVVKLFWASGGKDRDPRGWTISLAFATEVPWETEVVASDDAAEIGWFDIDDLPSMAFDHRMILSMWRALC
jgi:8-oxo-dGTP diphosphatase